MEVEDLVAGGHQAGVEVHPHGRRHGAAGEARGWFLLRTAAAAGYGDGGGGGGEGWEVGSWQGGKASGGF